MPEHTLDEKSIVLDWQAPSNDIEVGLINVRAHCSCGIQFRGLGLTLPEAVDRLESAFYGHSPAAAVSSCRRHDFAASRTAHALVPASLAFAPEPVAPSPHQTRVMVKGVCTCGLCYDAVGASLSQATVVLAALVRDHLHRMEQGGEQVGWWPILHP